MATAVPVVPPLSEPLSEGQRLAYVFTAPSKTFKDLLRNGSWWAPFLIATIISYGFMFAVQSRVGWDKVVETNIRNNPKSQAQMESAPPEQQEKTRHIIEVTTKSIFYAYPVLILIIAAIGSGILMLTCNFGLGGTGRYGQYFAMWLYANLPMAVFALVTILMLFATGVGDSFNLQNPLGTNPGFYLAGSGLPAPLLRILDAVDIFAFWVAVLLTIGCSVIGKITRTQAAIVVFGWWIANILLTKVLPAWLSS